MPTQPRALRFIQPYDQRAQTMTLRNPRLQQQRRQARRPRTPELATAIPVQRDVRIRRGVEDQLDAPRALQQRLRHELEDVVVPRRDVAVWRRLRNHQWRPVQHVQRLGGYLPVEQQDGRGRGTDWCAWDRAEGRGKVFVVLKRDALSLLREREGVGEVGPCQRVGVDDDADVCWKGE